MKKIKLFGLLALVIVTSIMMVACKNNDKPLDSATELQIRQDYFQTINQDGITLDDVTIKEYLGSYNGYIVVIISNGSSLREAVDINVGGFEFAFNRGTEIIAWRERVFFNLQDALDAGHLTVGNISTIHELWSKN